MKRTIQINNITVILHAGVYRASVTVYSDSSAAGLADELDSSKLVDVRSKLKVRNKTEISMLHRLPAAELLNHVLQSLAKVYNGEPKICKSVKRYQKAAS